MRILSEEDIERLVDADAAIAAAAQAFRMHAAGEIGQPGRLDMPRQEPKGGALVLACQGAQHFVVKSNLHAYPGAAGRRLAASLLTVWDAAVCAPLALISAAGFNNHRTAAGFAAAARAFAPENARTLAVFGAGKIAPATIRYLAAVRPFTRIVILGRTTESAEALADTLRAEPQFTGITIAAERDAAQAATAADVIATVTTSASPVFPGSAVRPGTFVILGGANRPDAREADDDLMRRAHVAVDHLDGCLARSGDLILALASGALARERIIGEVGSVERRPPDADVTVFKSIGIAAQDLVLAELLLARAEAGGVGLVTDLRGAGLGAPPARIAMGRR